MSDRESLVDQLHDQNADIRRKAAHSLCCTPDANVLPTLIEVALHDVESRVRGMALMALRKYPDERAIDAIIRSFDDPDEETYRGAGFSDTQKSMALPKLIDLFKIPNTSPQAKSHTAIELAFFYDFPEVVPVLLDSLNDTNETVRAACIETLGNLRELRAVAPVVYLLRHDESSHVRWHAAWALGQIGDKDAVVPLIRALHDTHPDVREYAAQSLGWLGDERAVEPLIAVVEDDYEKVRLFAVSALGDLRDKRATKALLTRLGDSIESLDVREEAALALGFVGDRRAAKYLNHLLNHNDIQFSLYCAIGLGWLKDTKSLPRLLEGVKYSVESVRAWSVRALGQLGSTESVEALFEVIQNDGERKYIRAYAAESLKLIGDPSVIEPLRNFVTSHDIPNLTDFVYKTIAELEAKVVGESIGDSS